MTTAIYSCDDHLDLSAVPPPSVWESRLARADAERELASSPVTRAQRGCARAAPSVPAARAWTRDPDGNLVELLTYDEAGE